MRLSVLLLLTSGLLFTGVVVVPVLANEGAKADDNPAVAEDPAKNPAKNPDEKDDEAKQEAAQQDAPKEKGEPPQQREAEPREKDPPKVPPRAPTNRSRRLLTPQQLYVPEAAPRQPIPKQAATFGGQLPRQNQNAQANGNQNPQRPPARRSGLSPSAAYQLGSMGTHVHLTPAMRWHLGRSQVPLRVEQPPNATVPGQGAEKFYPGVSRLPTQKPFSDVQRPQGGLQTYWPWLLEGRQDANTGLIIWTLP